MLAMFCGAVPSIHSTYNIIRRHGWSQTKSVNSVIAAMAGQVPPTSHTDGRVFQQSYDRDLVLEMTYDLMFRFARFGPTVSERHADVWPVIAGRWSRERRYIGEGRRWNFTLAARPRPELLRSAIAAGYISDSPLRSTTGGNARRSRLSQALGVVAALGLLLTGQPFPRYHRMRVVVAGLLEASWRERWKGCPVSILRGKRAKIGRAVSFRISGASPRWLPSA